ncbi:MAG: alanine dehydrogenase [Bacteroidales bacterium]|jgi:alanine dehydrogenase|nr:alanine dehydrogenase [Bacteroidales bacterium]
MSQENQFIRFAGSHNLMPQEEKLEKAFRKDSLKIGIPAEKQTDERRLALIPVGVRLLTEHGNQVFVQRGAGNFAQYSDHDFSEAGAVIVDDAREIYQSDLILKVAPPDEEELSYMHNGQAIFSVLQQNTHNRDWFELLLRKKLLGVAYENIQDKSGALPLLRSMGEIIGNMCVVVAAEYLCHPEYGKGQMLGGFPGVAPSEVVIIGSGNVAEYASRGFLGMGCLVKVFDNSMYKLRTLQNNLGQRIFTSALQPDLIGEALQTADVVIGAKHTNDGTTSCMISAAMIKKMKAGAVIIDVSIDQGGCFETSRPTTHKNPVFQEFGITHYAVPNMASRVPRTASVAFNNFFMPLLLQISEVGGVQAYLQSDRAFAKGVYAFNGKLTNHYIAQKHRLPFHHLELLLAAFY